MQESSSSCYFFCWLFGIYYANLNREYSGVSVCFQSSWAADAVKRLKCSPWTFCHKLAVVGKKFAHSFCACCCLLINCWLKSPKQESTFLCLAFSLRGNRVGGQQAVAVQVFRMVFRFFVVAMAVQLGCETLMNYEICSFKGSTNTMGFFFVNR